MTALGGEGRYARMDAAKTDTLATSPGGTNTTNKETNKERRGAMLLEYPAFEPMGVYDVDDLDPQGVFILLAAEDEDGAADGGGREGTSASKIYVWIGADAGDELELGDNRAGAGGRRGEECGLELGVEGGHDVRVEVEGRESAAFWEAFEEGT